MHDRTHFAGILTGALFLCFTLSVLSAAAYGGLLLHYRLFSDALEAPYAYYRDVLLPRLGRIWLVSGWLSVPAVILLAVCGVRRWRSMPLSRRTRTAAILCGCTLPLSLLLFLDLFIRGLALLV